MHKQVRRVAQPTTVNDAVNELDAREATRSRRYPSCALVICIGVWLALFQPGAVRSTPDLRSGGIVRVVLRSADVDSLDPALGYSVASYLLLDTTCALLLRATPQGLRPEVATGLPRTSPDRRRYTFTLRRDFRFSDGSPVQASAFARAINRTLARGVKSPWAAYTSEIVGAKQVMAGSATEASGVVARGYTLTVRFNRPVPDFPAQSAGFLCAVPPALPADPEGVVAFPAAGPYYIADYEPGQSVVIRRNSFYRGRRPHHVDGFDVDLRAGSHEEVLDRIERGSADWGWALTGAYFDPDRRLVAKYGVNRSQFLVQPGYTLRGYNLNTARPLFKDNVKLRRAVNFAIDRSALRRAGAGRFESRLTDQYLPPPMPGFKDVRIYPLAGPDLQRARVLARGNTRGGKAVLYTVDSPTLLAFAQSIKQNLAKIGLEVQIKGLPVQAYFGRFGAQGPYDIGFMPWIPDYGDPYAALNIRFDGRFIGSTNWGRFNSPEYNRLLRRAAVLQGAKRYRTYGQLDVRLARDAAPMVAVDVLNDPTLVSKRLGCVKPLFDLTAVCLK